MADDRERNQGIQQGGKDIGGGGGQQAPGRNPQDDRSAGSQPDNQQKKPGHEGDQERGGQEGGFKEGGQNEETRR
jgi:hypothetical protein